jgi:hypothetical protein
MITMHFSKPNFKTRTYEGNPQLFDPIRNKWVILQSEEWVRQNIIQWLIEEKAVPPSFISIEKTIQVGELSKRFDILVYDRSHQPWMMVECKAQEVTLDEAVLRQVLRYNLGMPVRYIVITNGNGCFAADKSLENEEWLLELPSFPLV